MASVFAESIFEEYVLTLKIIGSSFFSEKIKACAHIKLLTCIHVYYGQVYSAACGMDGRILRIIFRDRYILVY